MALTLLDLTIAAAKTIIQEVAEVKPPALRGVTLTLAIHDEAPSLSKGAIPFDGIYDGDFLSNFQARCFSAYLVSPQDGGGLLSWGRNRLS
jgi:hypothetical protein